MPAARKCCRTAGEGHGRTARVYVTEESDSGILPMNHSNKDGKPLAESEEGRPLIKENACQPNTYPTQSEKGVSQGLPGVRKAARENKEQGEEVHRLAPPSDSRSATGALLLIANVWLALLWSRHVHSERAGAWFERSSEEKFFFCRITQITVLRPLTTPMVMGSDVKTMSEAWSLWDKVCADDWIALLAEPEAIEPEFRRFSARRSSSPKVWADAYLVAFGGSWP